MSSLYNCHVKLLAFDFHSLTQQSPSNPTTFLRNRTPLSRVETVGIIVFVEHKPDNFLKFFVDDGTDVIPCILWLNQLTSAYFSRRNPGDVRVNATLAADSALGIRVGVVARVRGRIGVYRKGLQITVMDVVLERDPNAEMLHWVDCVRLARTCYDVVG